MKDLLIISTPIITVNPSTTPTPLLPGSPKWMKDLLIRGLGFGWRGRQTRARPSTISSPAVWLETLVSVAMLFLGINGLLVMVRRRAGQGHGAHCFYHHHQQQQQQQLTLSPYITPPILSPLSVCQVRVVWFFFAGCGGCSWYGSLMLLLFPAQHVALFLAYMSTGTHTHARAHRNTTRSLPLTHSIIVFNTPHIIILNARYHHLERTLSSSLTRHIVIIIITHPCSPRYPRAQLPRLWSAARSDSATESPSCSGSCTPT